MKVLFVASNPNNEGSLNLQVEITALQSQVTGSSVEPFSFAFLPALEWENLPNTLQLIKPDILHISAHGKEEVLWLSNYSGQAVRVDAETLGAFFQGQHVPRLVYLNACDSVKIAAGLVEFVPMAIGMHATITNHAARAGAVTFYQRLMAGASVDVAFRALKNMVKALSNGTTEAMLFPSVGLDPSTQVLQDVPEIVADFKDARPRPRGHEFWFQLGLRNCPSTATQIVFSTDDASLIVPRAGLQDSLCMVVRPRPGERELWSPHEAYWVATRDHRLFATIIKAEERPYTLSTELGKAVEAWYRSRPARTVPRDVRAALRQLTNILIPNQRTKRRTTRNVGRPSVLKH